MNINSIKPVVISLVFISILWSLSFFIPYFFPNQTFTKSGQFGDMFGAVNALFSGLAFAGIIYTIILQQQEISENQKETERQRFETIFFNMLNILNEIVLNVDGDINTQQRFIAGEEPIAYKGRRYMKSALKDLIKLYPQNKYSFSEGVFKELVQNKAIDEFAEDIPTGKVFTVDEFREEILNVKFLEFYKNQSSALAHYFRYVYNIMKFIVQNSVLKEPDKIRYMGLLQAQLSNDELGLIFYDALSQYGRNKERNDLFLQWLDKYKVLENMTPKNMMDVSHQVFYPTTTFKFTTFQK